jgi:hypothetical protein
VIVQVYDLGTGFKGAVLYLLHGHLDNLDPDRVDWIETRNLPTDDPLAASRIMAATARDRRTKQKPVYHFSISFDYNDPADRALMLRVADRLLHDLKMQGYQVIMIAHRDRAHAHLHLVVNRIHPEELTVWSNWNDYRRIERSLRAQEAELGLRVVPGFLAPVFDEDGKRLRPAQLVRGDADFLERVRAEAGPHLASARSWAELERELAAHGLWVRMKGRGMVVTDGKHEVKASDIDRAFSRSRLEARARLGIHGEYRLRQQIAARTLDESASPLEQEVVATIMPDTSAPADRIPQVTEAGELEPAREPAPTRFTNPAGQEEGEASDLGTHTVAADRVYTGTPVWTQYPGHVRVVAATDVPSLDRRPAREAVRRPERLRHEATDRENVLTDEPALLPVGNASPDAEAFLQMVERFRQREAVRDEVRKIDETREKIREWSRWLERTSADVKGATHDFAKQIRAAFRDPQAFSDIFKQLTEEQRRATLETLRARPAEFAREFLVSSGRKAVRTDEQPHGWRAMVANLAESLRGATPEQRVFRELGERAGVLAAAAGERYLDAVTVRDSVRRNVARKLGLSEKVTLTEVGEALSVRMAAADAQKAEALSLREAPKVPTVKQLEGAFLALRPEDRQCVVNAVPTIGKLIPKALHLVHGLASGPVGKSSGYDV